MVLENYSVLKMLVLEEVLGTNSTQKVSQELGFKFDKFKRWMKNEKILRWDEFEDLCQTLDLNFKEACSIFYFGDETRDIKADNVFSRLKEYNVFESNQQMATHLNCHVSVIKRYSKGETIPDVETVFKLMGFKPNILSVFLKRLFPHEIQNPLLSKWVNDDAKSVFFETKFPLSSLIEASLYLDRYKSHEGNTASWLSELLDFPLDEIHYVLKHMLEAEIISEQAPDFYVPTNTTTNLLGVSSSDILPFIHFLNSKVIQLIEKRLTSDVTQTTHRGAMVHRVAPASTEAMDKINDVMFKAHDDILKILIEDKNPKVEARVILMQTFTLAK
ncbi:MAG: hypothetical protein K2Q18_03065 [Bdellovibrionales bacterium]|nr:hypothetical protein [Bdellovibrionales bacterium]